MRAATDGRLLCRINGFGPWTGGRGRRGGRRAAPTRSCCRWCARPRRSTATLDLVAGRCGLGILIETQDAVDRAAALARRPLSRIYVGLNDLRIDRRSDRAVPAAGRRHRRRRPRRGGPAVRRRRADPARRRLPGVQRPARRRAGPRWAPTSPSSGGRSPPTWPAATRSSRCRACSTSPRRAARAPTAAAAAERRAGFVAAVTGRRRAGRRSGAAAAAREGARHRRRRLRRPAPGRPAAPPTAGTSSG